MANSTYDNMWQTAMGELSEQLHVEGVDDGDDGDGGGGGNAVSTCEITLARSYVSKNFFRIRRVLLT